MVMEESQGITEVSRTHPLGIINVCTKQNWVDIRLCRSGLVYKLKTGCCGKLKSRLPFSSRCWQRHSVKSSLYCINNKQNDNVIDIMCLFINGLMEPLVSDRLIRGRWLQHNTGMCFWGWRDKTGSRQPVYYKPGGPVTLANGRGREGASVCHGLTVRMELAIML